MMVLVARVTDLLLVDQCICYWTGLVAVIVVIAIISRAICVLFLKQERGKET